ncbi:MAG TPA: RNA polymerase sigma factor [Polyangia bacterium]|nr:RNA polymerase sigma factor [Polyangia bacterium]
MTKPLTAIALSASGRGDDRAAAPAAATASMTSVAPSLDALYRTHAATVTRWVSRLCGRDVEVDDIVHEIFLVVHKRLSTFRGDAEITTWLYSIAVRVVSDRRQARRWRRWFGWRGVIIDDDRGETVDAAHAVGPSALELLETQEAQRTVYQVLDRLSEEHRTALILFEIEGLSGQEIAAITGTSIENVWLRLHRARKQFTRYFLAWEAEHQPGER